MLKDITLGQYFPGDTPIHRLDPRTKILLTILYIAALFTANTPGGYVLAFLALAAVTALGRIPPRAMLKGLKPLIFIMIFTGVLNLFFTAGNDSFRRDGLISNQNIGAAYPANLNDPQLTDWIIYPELAVAQQPGQGRPGEFRDSHIWKEDDRWYMLVCSGSERSSDRNLIRRNSYG